MISHTHWDREWYLTREVFRTMLVRLIDKLLDIIDSNPNYVSFMLDGQTIVLEDYLAIRPENTDRLKSALQQGKILCGPWYILPDELLISGESHIRNYLIGYKVSSQYGGFMSVGYLPDSFGHPEQMPQIIRGLGMDTMIFWRGTSNAMKHTEFIWQAPFHEAQVLCIHMPAGYGNSAHLLPGGQSNVRLEKMIKNLHEKSHTDVVLLMNGSDHISVQHDILEIIDEFNQNTKTNYQIKLSTMIDYLDELKAELPELETFTGEFRYGDRSMLLGGTISTRMPLKQRNHLVQKKMERYLEPMQALQHMLGISTGFSGYSDYIWKKILENHAHDSICGCSIDEVHREMLTRFDCVEQLQDELMNQSIKQLEKNGVSREDLDIAAQLILFEPIQDRIADYVEIEVDVDPIKVQAVDYNISTIVDFEDQIQHPDIPKELRFQDENGREIAHVVLSKEKAYYTHLQDETLPEVYKVNRFKVGLMLPPFDYGVHVINVYKIDDEDNHQNSNLLKNSGQLEESKQCYEIENEFYRIEFDLETATLNVLDKKTGRLHRGVHRIVDKGDAGDEYTYSWPKNDKEYGLDAKNVTVKVESKGSICNEMIIQGHLSLPEQLTEDRKSRSSKLVDCELEIHVKLYQGLDRIDFHTIFDNQAKDHRLQVEFPTGVLVSRSSASSAFSVTQRDIDIEIPEQWVEYPQTTHPTHGFIDVGDEEYGLTVATLGLTEFEAENREEQSFIRLTLLRCVGWLSRTDLETRKGNGGWTIETPEAQCLGRHGFEYSLIYHTGDWRQGNSYGKCDRRTHGVRIQQLRDSHQLAVSTENPLSFLSSLPPEVRISAVKPAEHGDSVIVRLFSIADKPIYAELKLPDLVSEVYITNLKEERIQQLDIDKGILPISVEPFEIKTYEMICG